MVGLHLSQAFFATVGVAAAFLPLPSPILESERDTIIESMSRSVFVREVQTDEVRQSDQIKGLSYAYMPSQVGVPRRLMANDPGKVLSEQSHEDLFSALLAHNILPDEITAPALELASTEEEQAPDEELTEEAAPTIGVAERVVVPSIGIDIAVRTGAYDPATASWQVDDASAFHADTTVPVNDSNGTTLIYGHAKWGIFRTLPDVQPGAEVTVYTAEGIRFVYSFESVKQVDPSDMSLLTAEGSPKLVLQTCSGLFDQHRTLALFELKEIVRT